MLESVQAYLPLAAVAIVAGMVIFYLWRELRRAKAALKSPAPPAKSAPADEGWDGEDVADPGVSAPVTAPVTAQANPAMPAMPAHSPITEQLVVRSGTAPPPSHAQRADARPVDARPADAMPDARPGVGLHRRPAAAASGQAAPAGAGKAAPPR